MLIICYLKPEIFLRNKLIIASPLSCYLSRQGLELTEGTQSSQILLVAVYSGELAVLHALVP